MNDDGAAEGPEPARRSAPALLQILVCPVARTHLEYHADTQELISRAARLAYPIREGIPVMLADEARELAEDE